MSRRQSLKILLGIFLLSLAHSAKSYMHSEQQTIISFLSDGGVSFDEGPIKNLLTNPLIANRKVIVYSIAGNQKRKSFIMNYALRFMYANYKSVNLENDKPRKNSKWVGSPFEPLGGFSWKETEKIDRINAEIVVWSDIFLYEDSVNSYAILLMDTQGLYDTELSVTNNANILALNALFSTFFIYNVEYPMQAEKYENLRLSLEHAKKVLEAKVSHGGGDLKVKPFNDFVFLFRDVERKDEDNWGFNGGNRFVNKYFKFTDKAYLESFHINSAYDHVYGFSMPPPGDEASQINYDGRFSQLDEDFQSQLQDFIGEIFSPRHFKPKKIFGQDLTVKDYLMSVKVFCRSVKGNEIAPTNLIYKSEIDKQLKDLIDGFKFEMKGLDQTMVNSFLNVVDNERFKLVITLLQLHDNNNKLEKNDPMRNVNQLLENGVVRDFESWLITFHGVFLNSASIKINKENIGSIFDQSVVIRDGLKQLAHIVEEQQKVVLNSFQNVRNECDESANSTFNLMSNKYDRMINQQIKKVQDVCEAKDAILTKKIENLSNGCVDTVPDKAINIVFFKIGSYQEGKKFKVFYIPRFLRSRWSGARSICKTYGMDIATFETSKQMIAVSEMCTKNSEKITTGAAHVGATTLTGGSKTDWYWVTTGEKISYSIKWLPFEPNNVGGAEQCLLIGGEEFLYNDINCNGPNEYQFICEKVLG